MSENETDLEGSGTDSESTDYNSSDGDTSLMPAPYSYEPSGTESESDILPVVIQRITGSS